MFEGGDNTEEIVSVSAHDADDLEELGRGNIGDFQVFYADGPAHFQQDLVERSLAFIAQFPGVEDVVQEDRELIYGWGPSVDVSALQEAIIGWWRNQT
jgi:hypothetical protein